MISDSLRGFNLIMISAAFFFVILNPAVIAYFAASWAYAMLGINWTFPIILYFSLILYVAILTIEAFIILKVIYNPKIKQGVFSVDSPTPAVVYYALSETLMRTIEKVFSMLLIPPAVHGNILLKIFGKKCGTRNLINPINDPHLTSIGNDCIIGFGAMILGHEIKGKRIILKEVKIGNKVTIAAHVIISPGVVIEDDVVVGAKSYVLKDAVLKKGGFYVGCPAKLKKIIKC